MTPNNRKYLFLPSIVLFSFLLISFLVSRNAASAQAGPNSGQETASPAGKTLASATRRPTASATPNICPAPPTAAPTPSATPYPTDAPPFNTDKVATLGKGYITQTGTSPDGKVVVIGYGDGHVEWLDSQTGKVLGKIQLRDPEHSSQFTSLLQSVVFSQDSRLMILASHETFSIIDLSSNTIMAGDQTIANDGFQEIILSSDARYMVFREVSSHSGGGSDHLSVFLPFENKRFLELPAPLLTEEEGWGWSFSAPVISSDNRWVAAGTYDDSVFVWDLKTGELKKQLKGHASSVSAVAFQPGSHVLASASRDGVIRLWDVDQGSLLKVITGFKNDLKDVKFKNNQHLLVQAQQSQWQLVDISTGSIEDAKLAYRDLHPLVLDRYRAGFAHQVWGDVTPVFSPDEKRLALVSDIVQVWDIASRQLTSVITGGAGETVVAAAFSPNSTQIAVAFASQRIAVWDARDGTFVQEIRPLSGLEKKSQQQMVFSPNGQRIAIDDYDATEVFDVQTGQMLLSFPYTVRDGTVSSMTFSDDSRYLYLLRHGDSVLQIWDVIEGKQVRREEIPSGYDYVSSSRHSGWRWPWFARSLEDDAGEWIEIRNAVTGENRKIISHDSDGILQLSQDGNLLFAEINSLFYVWKTETGELASYAEQSHRYIRDYTVSPDASLLALTLDGQVELWNFAPVVKTINVPGFTPVPSPTERYPDDPTSTPAPVATRALTPQPTPALPKIVIAPQNVTEVKAVGQFGDGTITWAGWSQDGKQILVAGSQGIFGYEAENPFGSATLRIAVDQFDPGFKPSSLAKDALGNLLVAGTSADQVQVWNTALRQKVLGLPGKGLPELSRDGRLLVFQGEANNLVYDLTAQKPVTELLGYMDKKIWISADMQSIASMTYSDEVRIWNAQAGTIRNALSPESHSIVSAAFSSDWRYFAAAAGQKVYIWENKPGIEPQIYTISSAEAASSDKILSPQVVSFSPDGQRLAVAASDGSIQIIDRASGKLLRVVGKEKAAVTRLAFNPGGSKLLSVTENGQVSVWELSAARTVQHIVPAHFSSRIKGVELDQNGRLFAWGEHIVWKLRASDAAPVSNIPVPDGTIFSVSPDGAYAAVYENPHMALWPLSSAAQKLSLEGDPLPSYVFRSEVSLFTNGVFNQDGSLLGVTGTGGIWIYRTRSGKLSGRILGEYVTWMAFNPNDQFVLFNQDPYYGGASLHDVQLDNIMPTEIPQTSGFFLRDLPYNQQRGEALFSTDGKLIIQILVRRRSTMPDQVGVWSAVDGSLIKVIDLLKETKLVSVALDPTGRLAAAGMEDGRILLVDLSSGQIVTTLQGHHDKVNALAFSRNGRYLASCGNDALVKVWGLQ